MPQSKVYVGLISREFFLERFLVDLSLKKKKKLCYGWFVNGVVCKLSINDR